MRSNPIFVFGSNLLGMHGGGAAAAAREKYGAVWGIGEGRTGQSYALPTKKDYSESLAVEEIRGHVHKFLTYARSHPKLEFQITAVGCGLAGHKVEDIAPMFKEAPMNCILNERFKEYLYGTL